MLAEFALMVMYGQITVEAGGREVGGLLWSDDETAQGFAWSPHLVAFGVPDHDGICLLQIDTAATPDLASGTLWAVRVPFDVPDAGTEIGTILDTRSVPAPAGRRSIVFQALPGETRDGETFAYLFRLTFAPPAAPPFAILRRGAELSTDTVLRERADPA